MVNLSNVYLKKQNISEAQKYADLLLRINESSDEGIKLLISILNLKKSNDFTINYFENLLEKQPLSFKIIEVFLEVLRRFGK